MSRNPCLYVTLYMLALPPYASLTSLFNAHQLMKYLDLEDPARTLAAKGKSLDLATTPIPESGLSTICTPGWTAT